MEARFGTEYSKKQEGSEAGNFEHSPGFVDLNVPETKKLVLAVLDAHSKGEHLGSLGEPAAAALLHKLRYEDYCIKHGKEASELDEYDYENIAEESLDDRE